MDNIAPLLPGKVSTDASLAGDLGNKYILGGVEYMLVKATGAVTAAAKKFLKFAGVGSLATVNAVATAADKRSEVAGLVPSSVSGDLASGDYLLVIRRGIGTAIAGTASLAADVPLSAFTGGKVDDATVTFDITVAYSNEAQASADGDVEITVDLP